MPSSRSSSSRRQRRHPARAARLASQAALGAAAAVVAPRHGVPVARALTRPSTVEASLVGRAARGRAGPDGDAAVAAARARRETVYLAVTLFGLRQAWIAHAIGITPRAVRKALAGIEERRDDASYDRDLIACEQHLMGVA